MKQIVVDLNIPAEEFLKHYEGVANIVSAVSRDGRSVQFPTSILQPYVSREGVRGSFVIHFDDNFKFHSIEQLNEVG